MTDSNLLKVVYSVSIANMQNGSIVTLPQLPLISKTETAAIYTAYIIGVGHKMMLLSAMPERTIAVWAKE
jgi:hypothetical protein